MIKISILTQNEILKEIKKGNIKIAPFNKKNVGPASYDLTLSESFRTFNLNLKTLNVTENTDYRKITTLLKIKTITLKPGDFVLGITKEKIELKNNVCGWLSGRTRFARLGIGVHVTANFVQPGIKNKQILEIKNLSNSPLRLHAGTKIIQIIFQHTKGKENKYMGKFSKQTRL